MHRALAIVVIVSAAGCKTDDAKPASPVPARADRAEPVRDRKAKAEWIDTILLAEPRLARATPLAPLETIDGREEARQSWCIAGTDAQAIATEIADALTAAGWTAVRSRGTAERAAASGIQDGVAVSITVGGRDAACAGLVATAQYTTGTVTIPPLQDGERIR